MTERLGEPQSLSVGVGGQQTKASWSHSSGHDESASYVRVWQDTEASVELICEVEHDNSARSIARAEDRARLIAASPTMRAALVKAEAMLVAAYGEPSDSSLESKLGSQTIREVRAALALATLGEGS